MPMRRSLAAAVALVVGVLTIGAGTAVAAEIRDDVVCGGDRQAQNLVVENVGAPAPAELPGFVAPYPVPTGVEQIHDYDVAVTTNPDGSADFTETIVYDFGTTPDRHGILRDLRLSQPCNDQWQRVYPMSQVKVTSPTGAPTSVKLESSNGVTTIRVGDADKNVHGVQTYVLQYHLDGVINGFADHDELYWNAIGPGWNVVVWNGVVHVTGPAPPARITCYAGPVGAATLCDAANVTDGVAGFQQQSVAPNGALTVAVAYPQGTFTATPRYFDEQWSLDRAFTRNVGTVGAAGVLMAVVVGGVVALAFSIGRDRKAVGSPTDVAFAAPGTPGVRVGLLDRQGSPVDFAPPDKIRPAQFALVRNEQVRNGDVAATIVDLAVRGFLRIEEVGDSKRHPDYQLERLREPDATVLPYENKLLASLFAGQDALVLSQFEDTFAAKLQAVKDLVYTDGVDHGWFSERPDKVVRRWRAIGFLVTLLGAGLLAAAIAWTTLALLPVPVLVGGLLVWMFAKRFPARTAAGTGMRRRASGFEIFLRDSEAPRARWAEQRNIFSEYLPYAIVLGIATKWAKTFEPLGAEAMTGTTAWYIGREPFSADRFGHATESFAAAASSTLSSVPQSSSGSSGFSGGSSGGGGGGGGGGSW
jgi:uncharacterized membrane protein YgcG